MNHHFISFFFNFIGGTTRWLWGTLWRSMARRKKYTFKEYLPGPNPPEPGHENHDIINFCIGIAVFFFIIAPLLKKL